MSSEFGGGNSSYGGGGGSSSFISRNIGSDSACEYDANTIVTTSVARTSAYAKPVSVKGILRMPAQGHVQAVPAQGYLQAQGQAQPVSILKRGNHHRDERRIENGIRFTEDNRYREIHRLIPHSITITLLYFT